MSGGRTGVRSYGRTAALRWPALVRASVRLYACTLLAACASTGDPPGGPPDEEAPQLVSTSPEPGAVLERAPAHVDLGFNEVISERIAATPPTIAGAVIVSPSLRETRVSWKRTRLEARPAEGFAPGRVYRVEVLPVITDLRQNRMTEGRVFVFSTGPPIPTASLQGAVADWVAGRAAVRALVEAVLLPDSLPYRTVADSTGYFTMPQMPAGTYLVYGIMDTNGDRRRGTREGYDTVRVELSEAASIELYAFVHDTVGPRLRQVEPQDSLTVKLTFDRPIDPTFVFDTAQVTLAAAEDTTSRLPVAGVWSQLQLDSMRAAADSARRASRDSAAVPAELDPAAAPAPPRRPAAPAGRGAPPAGDRGPRAARPTPLDSTMVQRMLARRTQPTDVRYLRLAAPLEPDARYAIILEGVRGLTGALARSRGQVRVPPAPPRAPVAQGAGAEPPPDSLRPDTVPVPAPRDSAASPRPDSTRRSGR